MINFNDLSRTAAIWTQFIWTTWTSLSAVQERLLNLITHSSVLPCPNGPSDQQLFFSKPSTLSHVPGASKFCNPNSYDLFAISLSFLLALLFVKTGSTKLPECVPICVRTIVGYHNDLWHLNFSHEWSVYLRAGLKCWIGVLRLGHG